MDRFLKIVVPTDFSPLSDAAAARAGSLAALDGAAVHLVHAFKFPLVVTPYEVSVPTAIWEGVRRAAQERLEEARKALEGHGARKVTAEIANSGDPADAIAAAVDAHAADLVVMGTHGHTGFKRAFLGSVAAHTLHRVTCPVLAVKQQPDEAAVPITRILLAVDFSSHSSEAVEAAAGLAQRLGASVDVVHAFVMPRDFIPYASDLGMELEEQIWASVTERLEGVREKLEHLKIPVTLHALRGDPSSVIADLAKQIDCQLVVMGRRGLTGLSHVLLGSVAERTLRTAPCSVMTINAAEGREGA
jgi:nucleotide-binding universal stress UspA family protein